MLKLAMALAVTILLSAVGAAEVAARAVGSPGAVTVTGEGNTLASIAADVGDAKLFRLEGKRAICAGAFTLRGGLTMGPGEALVMENPEGEWARRFVYLLGGPMALRDCAIEGAYWVHVGPEARGTWRNVRLVSGPNAASGYPLLYFESSEVDWDGGEVDAAPSREVFSPIAFSARGGYYPGSVRNTIRNVRFRAKRAAIQDRADHRGHEVDLTFQGCHFETEGVGVTSNVNVADGERTRLAFEDCRWNGTFELTGSAVKVVVVEGERRVVHTAPGLRRVGEGGKGDLAARLGREVPELRAALARMGEQEGLRGSLFYPRLLFGQLTEIERRVLEAGRYGPADGEAVEHLVAAIWEMAETLPQTLVAGSPYRPKPQPPPESPPTGVARIVRAGPGRVRVENYESTLFYDGRADEKRRARITEESTIRGHRMFAAYPELGGPSLRFATPTESSLMLWEQPWDVEIVQSDARIVGFKAKLGRFERLGTAVTHVFFYDLPDVILFDVESIQKGGSPQPPRVRFQAYADPAGRTYNGMRFWNLDPEGISQSFGTGETRRIFASDPVNGVFVTGPGEWYQPNMVNGLVVAQYNGANEWRTAPPCGFIIRPGGRPLLYANNGGYYGHVVDLPPPPAEDPEPLRHRLLWFEGGGLRCWENIHNLEAAFNHPCRLEPVVLRAGVEPVVTLAETDGLQRNFEIAILPGALNRIRTERPVFRGDSTVFLLKNVSAHTRTTLGTLPVRLAAVGPQRFTITSELAAPLEHVEIHLDRRPTNDNGRPTTNDERPKTKTGRSIEVRHGGQAVVCQQVGDELVYVATVAPGETEVVVQSGE